MNKQPKSAHIIRFSDCDLFGHLNNGRYIDYFLNAREDHLRLTYQMNLNEFYKRGVAWVVGGHEISYLKPALYNEEVVITSALIEASGRSLLVEFQMLSKDEMQAKALMWTQFVPINVKTGKPEEHLPDFMEFAKSITLENDFVNSGLRSRVAQLRKGNQHIPTL